MSENISDIFVNSADNILMQDASSVIFRFKRHKSLSEVQFSFTRHVQCRIQDFLRKYKHTE